MNRLRFAILTAGAILSVASSALAGSLETAERTGIIRHGISATSYSLEVPVLARVQGTAFFKTSLAIINNTNKSGVTASYQFSYSCLGSVASPCSPAGGFYRTTVQTVTLQALDAFVQDDFIDYLNSQGLLQPGANAGTIGTLLVTFNNLPSSNGFEANVVARVYNRLVESDPNQGTVGFAFNASLFFDSADTTLIGYGRDTKSAATVAGRIRTNLGVRNTDINGTNQDITVDISAYDTATGQKVGNPFNFTGLKPGEIRQISDFWNTLGIAPSVHNVIIFVDARNPTATSPTIEGYVTLIDGQSTQDAALFPMLCGDANGCGN